MAAESQHASDRDLAWERHGRMWKVIGALTVVLFVASQFVAPTWGIALIIMGMAFGVLASWHLVLYYKGRRERAATVA